MPNGTISLDFIFSYNSDGLCSSLQDWRCESIAIQGSRLRKKWLRTKLPRLLSPKRCECRNARRNTHLVSRCQQGTKRLGTSSYDRNTNAGMERHSWHGSHRINTNFWRNNFQLDEEWDVPILCWQNLMSLSWWIFLSSETQLLPALAYRQFMSQICKPIKGCKIRTKNTAHSLTKCNSGTPNWRQTSGLEKRRETCKHHALTVEMLENSETQARKELQ